MATTTPPELAGSLYAGWTFEDAVAAIEATQTAAAGKDGYEANHAFIEDVDHWQDGDTWVGPDGGGSAELRAKVLAAVERQYTPVNAVGEVVQNVANGLLKREADIAVIPVQPTGKDGEPSDAQQKAAAAIRAQLAAWWDARKLWDHARAAVRRSRWAGYGTLRLWINPDALVETERDGEVVLALPTGLTFEQALGNIHLHAPTPDVAAVYTDPDTQQRCALFRYTEEAEDGKDEVACVELWYLDGDEAVLTILRDDEEESREEYRVPLGGRLPIAQMEADVLITDPVRRQQNRLNFFESLLTRVGETAGFPERYTLNAAPHGIWLTSPPADGPALETQEVGGKTWYLHRAPRAIGAAITTDLRGVKTTVETTTGGVHEILATPNVVFKEPTDPDYAIRACEHARATILRSCSQGHLVTTSQAETSGDAYEQARTAFENDLETTRGPLEGMIRTILEAAIAMAEAMSTPAEGGSRLAQFRIGVTCHVHAGPVSALQKQAIVLQYEKGLISRQTALAKLGVEDTAAELAALDADPLTRLTLLTKQAEALRALTDAGVPIGVAAELAGFEPAVARKMALGDTDPVVEQ